MLLFLFHKHHSHITQVQDADVMIRKSDLSEALNDSLKPQEVTKHRYCHQLNDTIAMKKKKKKPLDRLFYSRELTATQIISVVLIAVDKAHRRASSILLQTRAQGSLRLACGSGQSPPA